MSAPVQPEPVPDEGVVSVTPVKPEAEKPKEDADYEWVDEPAVQTERPEPLAEEPEAPPEPIEEDEGEETDGGVEEVEEVEEAESRPIDPKLAEIRRRDAEAREPERRLTADEVVTPGRKPGNASKRSSEDAEGGATVIAFANQKGGVAKTTTTLNLAVAFQESGHRVLCIDMDPQGNLTMSQGVDPDKVEVSIYDVLVHGTPISEVIHNREIDVAVASIDLAGAEIAMSAKIGRERALQKALDEVRHDYDFVCIDTPPSLGLLTVNALTAAHKVIVPVQCEYLSMRGLVQLQNTLSMIRENLNPDVKIEGILPTMMDTRTVHAKEAIEILEENFGDLVFKSRIRKTIKFAEAPVRGSSVLKYDPDGKAASYYRELAEEVLTNGS